MRLKKLFYLTTFLTLISLKGHAQLNANVLGSAEILDNNCFLITPAVNNQSGGVWYDNSIDFSNDFTIYYQSYFGSNDANGADGMALVFKPSAVPAIGSTGAYVGYGGIGQSLIVEFDTFQNNGGSSQGPEIFSDPTYDHIAIMKNGIADHASTSNLAGPIQASGSSANIEDGIDHEVKIEWIANTQTFNIYFDCNLRLSITDDLKNTIFGGDSTVYFGFVGSTGGLNNIHRVCFNSISFVDNLTLDDETICEGNDIQIDASIPSGDAYLWSPAEGVSDIYSAIPILSPTVTTTYSVLITDTCGDPSTQSITINVANGTTPFFDQIPPICEGDSLNSLPTTSSEGITGAWAPALNNTLTTTYTFTPDTGQCALTTTMTVSVNPAITPVFTLVDPICEGDTLNALPTISNEGITGIWSPAIDNTITTLYTFSPDAGQCASEAVMTVSVSPAITAVFTSVDPICEGATLNALPTLSNEGITGTWSPAVNNSTTTAYTFTPDSDQCAISSSLTIVVNQKIDPIFDSIDSICEGDSLNTLPTTSINGINGIWSPALDNTMTTEYSFTPDSDQCANPASVIITVLSNTTPTFNQLDPICRGGSFVLPSASNEGITGTWSPAIDNSITTEYTFTPDAGQCATEAAMTVAVQPITTPTFTQVDPICVGAVLLNLPTVSNNNIPGTWSPALDNTTTTEYTFTPDSVASCIISSTMTISVLTQTVPEFTQVDPICIGDSMAELAQISNNGITGNWFPTLNNLETTTYTFSSDPGQCADSATMTIVVNPISTLTISATNLSENFDSNQVISVLATGGSGSYEYQLDGGPWQAEAVFEYVTGCDEHSVAVRDIFGCSSEPETTIMVMAYPKFFTPNGDGFNDTWNINCLREYPLAKVHIYDRFGKLLLAFRPDQNAWDGTYKGQLMPVNDYWFEVSYLNSSGVESQFRSHFSIRY